MKQRSTRKEFLLGSLALAGSALALQTRLESATKQDESKSSPQIPEDRILLDPDYLAKQNFLRTSEKIYQEHFRQTLESVKHLEEKYRKPAFGKRDTLDFFLMLSRCVDLTDARLFCTSQLTHTLQVIEGMEEDGISDEILKIAALTHDLGKILTLTGEEPHNVMCYNTPIGVYPPNVGLDQVKFQWNHDEFIYHRLKNYLPKEAAWLIRYHSMSIEHATPYMNDSDRLYTEKYLRPFHHYDQGSKSVFHTPKKDIFAHKELLFKYLPTKITL
jgi:inositol oxygenase